MGDRRGAEMVVMKKPEEKGSLVRPRRTRADKVKTKLQEEEVGGGAFNWMYLAQDKS